MTEVIVFAVFCIVILLSAASQSPTRRQALVRGLALCALPLAAISLWMPYRIDLAAVAPVSFPVDDGGSLLTQALFTFGCACFSACCIGFCLFVFHSPLEDLDE